jgi:hypothetical protein
MNDIQLASLTNLNSDHLHSPASLITFLHNNNLTAQIGTDSGQAYVPDYHSFLSGKQQMFMLLKSIRAAAYSERRKLSPSRHHPHRYVRRHHLLAR